MNEIKAIKNYVTRLESQVEKEPELDDCARKFQNEIYTLQDQIANLAELKTLLYEENIALRNQIESENYRGRCVVCIDSIADVLLLPCKHLSLCASCARTVKREDGACPVCRKLVKSLMTVYPT